MIGLNEDNNEFVSFLCSDMGQNILTNNSLSIHVERGNIFYDNFSTNENFYNFLLAQQDETEWFIPKRISYHRSFERYMKQFLPAFSLEESDKYDFLTNKSSNYLLYKFSDWIELLNAEKIKIRHSSVVKNDVGLIGIEKKTTSFWQKKLSAILKKIIPTWYIQRKNQKLCSKLKKRLEALSTCLSTIVRWCYRYFYSINPFFRIWRNEKTRWQHKIKWNGCWINCRYWKFCWTFTLFWALWPMAFCQCQMVKLLQVQKKYL